MPLAAGTILGQYEIHSPLGAGGMGEVYRAHDTRLDREVAIKVLPESVTADPERLRRFEQEARAAAALNHPNILAVYQMATHDGVSYMVTELLDGETLRERLRRGPLPLRKAIDYAVQIAHGLAAAHEKGIVHRDLKPENLFVTKDGRVKILDFGLAKLTQPKDSSGVDPTLTQATEPGVVMGTVGYMSPEQVRGKPADHRSDIFAFGTILYEMVTGKQIFRKPTKADTISAILHEDPPSISQLAPTTPPGLQRVVHRCLEKNPEQRFHSAHDLAFALEALSDTSASAISTANRTVSDRKWAWIAAAVVVIAVTTALVSWWRRAPPIPVVEAVTQLTDDGEAKFVSSNLLTDGSRIYFNEGTAFNMRIGQVAVTGGPTAIIPTRFAIPPIFGLDPDGSALLAGIGSPTQDILPLWTIPLPVGEPHRLGNLKAQDASFCPDGRILFSLGKDLYLADKEGSNAHKLLSADGLIGEPSMSPDGAQIVFTSYPRSGRATIFAAKADGSGVHPITTANEGLGYCCARWMADGRHIVFQNRGANQHDLWMLPMKAGFLQQSGQLIHLTAGPLSYSGPVASRDGKQIFAAGTKQRGELVRYDGNSKQFVPFLSGISAFNPTFSRDGKWVAYASYPDHSLWRSRSDGTDRLQLTFPPVRVQYPFMSADGKSVAFGTSEAEIYVISMEGGPPQKVADKRAFAASWSPDGNLLVYADYSDALHTKFELLDLRTGNRSVVPGSQDLIGVQWVAEDMLVATTRDHSKVLMFDVKTQQWSDLVPGPISGGLVNWAHSPDYKYVYYTTGGAEPQVLRVRLADHKVETITSLKDLPRATGPDGNTQISVAPDGSPVFTRDTGTQEIYALTLKWQ